MTEPTIIAVDWSGAKKTRLRSGIWLAVIQDGRLVRSEPVPRREEAVAFVESCAAPVVAGFDFSFGAPAWFTRKQGCSTIGALWDRAARDGDRWLGPPPTRPFWRDKGTQPPRDRRFRQCEEALKLRGVHPSSIFMIVGPATVGNGSVRGMPLLSHLHDHGFAIWPFDRATERTVIEIYPSLLRKLAPHHDVGPFANGHERDAVVSARVMWDNRAYFASLPAATDPVTRIEGAVWMPEIATSSL